MKVCAFPHEAGILVDVPEFVPERAEAWLKTLPSYVGPPIIRAFTSQTSWTDPDIFLREHPRIRSFFFDNSTFAKLLMTNPATFEMLERVVYRPLAEANGPIDPFLWETEGAAALRSRHNVIVEHLSKLLDSTSDEKVIRIVDLGSGPGRYLFDLLRKRPDLRSRLIIRCIDNDPKAIATGNTLWSEMGLSDIVTFQEVNITSESLVIHPEETAELGLLVGVICGFPRGASLRTLQRASRFLSSGAILIVSNVSEKILLQDPFTAWVLRVIFGWKLVHKTVEQLLDLCKRAGYRCNPEEVFTDEYGHHNMAICRWQND